VVAYLRAAGTDTIHNPFPSIFIIFIVQRITIRSSNKDDKDGRKWIVDCRKQNKYLTDNKSKHQRETFQCIATAKEVSSEISDIWLDLFQLF